MVYGPECISALHHNKRKTNYHIHLIFAERELLDNSFLAEIIRFEIKALELLIAKVLLAAAKVAERVVDDVHEKVVERNVFFGGAT
jgi:hypothetical protein